MLSEVFWVAFVTTVSGLVIKLASLAYRSKCKECSVCCIKVIRDTESEVISDIEMNKREEKDDKKDDKS